VLERIFEQLDCSSEGFISAEGIWTNLLEKFIIDHRFNIFFIETDDNIRTASVNDFILKNWETKEGYINKREFISGILLGYWDRHVLETGIDNSSQTSGKYDRWTDTGQNDYLALHTYDKRKVLKKKLESIVNLK